MGVTLLFYYFRSSSIQGMLSLMYPSGSFIKYGSTPDTQQDTSNKMLTSSSYQPLMFYIIILADRRQPWLIPLTVLVSLIRYLLVDFNQTLPVKVVGMYMYMYMYYIVYHYQASELCVYKAGCVNIASFLTTSQTYMYMQLSVCVS